MSRNHLRNKSPGFTLVELLVVIAIIVFATFQPFVSIESNARILMGLLGFVLAFVWWNSDFATRDERKERRGGRPSTSPKASKGAKGTKGTKASEGAPRAAADDDGKRPDSEEAGRSAGRSAAQTYLAAKRLKKALIDDRNASDST